jgi:hypothetical protein
MSVINTVSFIVPIKTKSRKYNFKDKNTKKNQIKMIQYQRAKII